MIAYRPEIDGLRALAVVPIVLFHAGVETLSGGYIGVDIFFVISGYLIGSIILGELDAGDFRFSRFYARRARRILPALLVMVFVTLLAGYWVMLPGEWTDLALASTAALFFMPNVYYWLESSTYFGLDTALQPLLHTWSLGVEEQFYLLVPALLLLLRRLSRQWPRDIGLALLALCVLSFWLNVQVMSTDAKFSFYMLPARAWELLTGVLLAIALPRIQLSSRLGDSCAGLGIALCLGAILLLDEQSPFPGSNALYPVLGTALIIAGTGFAPAGRVAAILSLAPCVTLGRLSYSLYLWHWPVIVYLGLARPEHPGNLWWAIALSLALAAVSYRWVESRYRRPPADSAGQRRRELQGLMAATLMLCLLLGLTKGLPARVPESAWGVAGSTAEGADYGRCETLADDPSLEAVRCLLGTADALPTVALWGDSHANALAPALATALEQQERAGWLYFGSGCRPLLGVNRVGRDRCQRFNDVVAADLAAQTAIHTVYLAGYWRLPLMGQSYDNAGYLIEDDRTGEPSLAENRAAFQRGLTRTLDLLAGRRAVIVEDVPEVGAQFGKSVANQFVRQRWLGGSVPTDAHFVLRSEDDFPARFNRLLAENFARTEVLRLLDVLCTEDRCPLLRDGGLLYYDGDHLSETGSLGVAPLFYRDMEANF
jgi:peptidoglycan/LPS O-acetylase OafA/YrhL